MSNDTRNQLHRVLLDGQQKYVYFLLAAAGAAVGFGITQTQEDTIALSKIPLGIAALCWGLSFYAGCRQLEVASGILQQNYQLMRVQDGLHPEFPNVPVIVAEIQKFVEQQANESGTFGMWQFRLLMWGGVSYIAWHILEMWLRTKGLPSTTGHP